MKKFGCALMILPAIAVVFFMVKFNGVGPVVGTTMWIVFFIGLWIANAGNKEVEKERKVKPEIKSQEPIKTITKLPVKNYNPIKETLEHQVQELVFNCVS